MPQEVAVLREETASTQLSLEAEIDQFCLEKEEEALESPVELSDSETESDRFSAAHPPKLIVARVNTSSEEEEKGMDLKQRIGLKGLLANKNKGSTSKEAPKIQVPPSLPPSPPPFTNLGLHANPNLKKKRPLQDLEEGEVALQKETKQQRTIKDPKDKRATLWRAETTRKCVNSNALGLLG